ncbi:hypothetical protein C9374_003377 [Naegleria lovaniensis]|uniref:SAP domain-containing protein n=1 Tax=Naegleria lovaniensis TaxID=51637 RepID=A0AA88GR86_NAELO|nr:uncharacterized protein C9374_003377 [Naegleria lovaniensis]KAG2385562.1 hypothetical protein C9374_003377 [Naegleria lovaniensis]
MFQTPKRVAFQEAHHDDEEAPSLILSRTSKNQTSCKLILKKVSTTPRNEGNTCTPSRSTSSGSNKENISNNYPISEVFASPVQVKKRATRRRVNKSSIATSCVPSVSSNSSSHSSSENDVIGSEEDKEPSPLTPIQQNRVVSSPKPQTSFLNDSIFDSKTPTSHRYSLMKTPVTSRKQPKTLSPGLFSPFNSVAPLLNSVYSKKSKLVKAKPKIKYGITEEELNKHYTISELREYCVTHSEKKQSGLSKKELVEKVLKILEPTSQVFILTSPRIADIKRKQRNSEPLTEEQQAIADVIERFEDDSTSDDNEMDDVAFSNFAIPSIPSSSKGSAAKIENNLYSLFYNLGLRSISSMRSYCLENNINATGNRDTLKRRIILHLSKTQAKD